MDFEDLSIYVPPLKIKKSRQDAQDEVKILATTHPSNAIPSLSLQDDSAEKTDAFPPTFQSFLRACYSFTPSTSVSPNTITLCLNAGDVIMVHSVHTNGWADGTLLSNGERGWLPTNYCETYDQASMKPLLKSLTELWDLIRLGTTFGNEVFQSQDYLRGLIAGIRFLLERCDCLTRDSPLVKTYDGLRKSRKVLLSELSLFVKIGKRFHQSAGTSQGSKTSDALLDEMLLQAFTIVTKAVHFLDIWNTELQRAVSAELDDTNGLTRSSISTTSQTISGSTSRSQPISPDLYRTPIPADQQSHSDTLAFTSNSQSPRRNRSKPIMLAVHRLSYTESSTHRGGSGLLSEHLTKSYDSFLGVLASFLGSHMQSRSSTDLLITTQQAVNSCRNLLIIIELVQDQETYPDTSLSEAKNTMCQRITTLVQAAHEVFRPRSPENEMIFLPENSKSLVNAATACVRIAGECVAKTRTILETSGDFQFPSHESINSSVLKIHSFSDHLKIQNCSSPNRTSADSLPPVTPSTEQVGPLQPSPIPDLPSTVTTHGGIAISGTQDCDEPENQSSLFKTAVEEHISSRNSQSARLQRRRSLTRTVMKSSGSQSTDASSNKGSGASIISSTSTRATSPDGAVSGDHTAETLTMSSEGDTFIPDDVEETEAKLLQKTYAHELMFNKEGQVIGGSLPALIEKLTAHDSTPDPSFTSTFYLTFRLFVSPKEFVESLVDRFEYVRDSPQTSVPVRLRVYNVFKCWLESHWRHDCDDVALPDILDFARNKMTPVLSGPGTRLIELAGKVSTLSTPLVPRLVTSIGKTNIAVGSSDNSDAPLPPTVISKTQLLALRTWKMGGPNVSIIDLDPLELARQITLKVSSLFCSILPEELLATEWQKRSGSLAVNVNALSKLSTDFTNLVADSILHLEEPKKRAAIIKHWVRIAEKCLELNNLDTLMSIVCSLNSTTILRMKRTWDIVSQKTKNSLQELVKTVDISHNSTVIRQRLQNQKPPCIPFVGMYLTDLTFVDHGNPMTRQLHIEGRSISVINFDKHVKTARIISDLQRFQVPYRLTEVPELQIWMQDQLVRVRSLGEASFQNHYRRSLLLEPREQLAQRNSTFEGVIAPKDRFDLLAWAHIKDRPLTSHE